MCTLGAAGRGSGAAVLGVLLAAVRVGGEGWCWGGCGGGREVTGRAAARRKVEGG